jgi:tyrosinase
LDVELRVNNSADPRARYLSWSPSPCSVRLSNPTGATGPVAVTLRNRPGGAGGQIVFRQTPTGAAASTLALTLPLDGTTVRCFLAGRFGAASVADGDTFVQIRRGTTLLAEVPLMVRIRKDANTLSVGERDRFLAAFARLNNQGAGRFVDFRNMHTNAGSPEAHGNAGFLPWHRAYLLDLERELQAIDPSVTLPYWRFDRPAPNLFTREFLGVANPTGTVQFSASNPLQFWRTDGVPGINRRPFFDTATESASVISEAATLALGANYSAFRAMEGSPHGSAHTSFGGSISSISMAARDPLFFLLHCNVDRLWARWQRANGRFDATQPASYHSNLPTGNRIGHNLQDTMWPWNGIVGGQRPPTAPGGSLATTAAAAAPGPQPRVRDTLDYQGALSPAARLGFDYDDVRYS